MVSNTNNFKEIYLKHKLDPKKYGPESNGNEVITLNSQELQNWSLTIRYSLVSYTTYDIMFR